MAAHKHNRSDSKVAQAAHDSKDTLKTLRIAHVAALSRGSRYRVLDEDGYDALAPAVGEVLPALVDDLSEKSRRDLGTGVTRNLQVVAEGPRRRRERCRGGYSSMMKQRRA